MFNTGYMVVPGIVAIARLPNHDVKSVKHPKLELQVEGRVDRALRGCDSGGHDGSHHTSPFRSQSQWQWNQSTDSSTVLHRNNAYKNGNLNCDKSQEFWIAR